MIEPWQAVRRLLVVRLDNLGDVLLTTPAIHALRESLPEAEITLLASPVGAQVGQLNPDIDDVIVYQAPWMDPWQKLAQESRREQAMIERIRARRFDGAIIFTSFRQSALPAAYLCYLADIPLRAAASIDGPGSLLTTRHQHPERMMHEVERGLDLVEALGFHNADHALILEVPDRAREEAAAMLLSGAALGGRSRPLLVLHPGCSMPARTYPWERYAEVADLATLRLDAVVLLTGSAEERELVQKVRSRMRQEAIDLAGQLSFPGLCALLEAADLTITNNTGPMHLSAAVQTPVVALFALTNPPEQWGPWQVPHRQLFHEVPCRLCYRRICPFNQECLRLVRPDEVVEAAAELLVASRSSAERPILSPASEVPG